MSDPDSLHERPISGKLTVMIGKAEIEQLTVAEKILLVEDIWDSLAANPGNVSVTNAEREELDRRWAEHQANPATALSMETFKERLNKML